MHTDNVICCSGGKDSMALLYMLQPLWDDATVLWVNTGAAHDSTLAQMAQVRAMVPHFVEVRSDVMAFIEENGFPVDILPVWNSPFTRGMAGSTSEFCAAQQCCAANLWLPAQAAIRAMKAKVVYRGQKLADAKQSAIPDGHIEDGVVYRFPLAHWSDADVLEYLGVRAPAYYALGELSSRDCWLCTAYLDKNAQRIHDLPEGQRQVVVRKLADLKFEIERQRQLIDACLGEQ